MKAGIIDVGGWQTDVCMKTGRKTLVRGNIADIVRPILSNHRYPGDREPAAITWVTDVAQDVVNLYHPDYLMLAYATPYFLRYNEGLSGKEWEDLTSQLLDRIGAFCESEGYCPVIVGTGGMVPYQGSIDLTGLSGLADAGGPVHHMAAVMDPTEQDYQYLSFHPHVTGVYTREELMETFLINPSKSRDIPDLLVIAQPGYNFKALGSFIRPCRYLSDQSETIPVTGLGSSVHDITDISAGVLSSLESEKTALVIIEGFGDSELSGHHVNNCDQWFRYTVSGEQYLAITTGMHISRQPWPPGYRGLLHDGMNKSYPLSGYINQIPKGTIGNLCSCPSAAVGTRSIFTHISSGTDITIECKVCNQYNHGSMAILSDRAVTEKDVRS
jgi:hypothetical protein